MGMADINSNFISEIKNVKLCKLPVSIEELSLLCLNEGKRVLHQCSARTLVVLSLEENRLYEPRVHLQILKLTFKIRNMESIIVVEVT